MARIGVEAQCCKNSPPLAAHDQTSLGLANRKPVDGKSVVARCGKNERQSTPIRENARQPITEGKRRWSRNGFGLTIVGVGSHLAARLDYPQLGHKEDDAAPAWRQLAINACRYKDESVLPSLCTGREAPDFDPGFLILVRQRSAWLRHVRGRLQRGANLAAENGPPSFLFDSVC
jgi:hypothetical protein